MFLTVRANLAAMKTYFYCQVLKFIRATWKVWGNRITGQQELRGAPNQETGI